MTRKLLPAVLGAAALLALIPAQPRPARVQAVGASAGYQHETVTEALVAIHELGRESGLWETVIRTDTQLVTFRALPDNARNLEDFDAVFFYTSGELPMDPEQKSSLLQFVREGRGFLGAHSASDTFYEWPEFGELIGGYFDGHPWNQFEATLLVRDREFPATAHLPARFRLLDEIYQIRGFSPERSRLLLELDTSGVDMQAPGVRRKTIPVAWSHSFGQGRVFYCSLGHRAEVWRRPEVRSMWLEAFRWAMASERSR